MLLELQPGRGRARRPNFVAKMLLSDIYRLHHRALVQEHRLEHLQDTATVRRPVRAHLRAQRPLEQVLQRHRFRLLDRHLETVRE